MILYLKAATSVPDLVIDYIEAVLQNGKTVSLNWDESSIDRTSRGFYARYKGVYFNEEYANGKLDELLGMKVAEIGLFSEIENTGGIDILEMLFEDDDRELEIAPPIYSTERSDLSG